MREWLALASLLGLIAGIALESVLRIPLPGLLFLLLLSAGFFFAWFFGRRDSYLFPALFLLLLSLGGIRTLLVPVAPSPVFASLIGERVTLPGMVVADPDLRETRKRITIEVREGRERMRIIAITDRFAEVAYGDHVTVSGMLSAPESFRTDGEREFNYPMFLAKDGVFALIERAHVEVAERGDALLPLRVLYATKHVFAHALEAALPEPHASLAEGLLVGGKQGLGRELLDAFAIVGLLPIVVLSGYNVMVVAQALMDGLSFLPRRSSIAIAAVAIILFVLAAGTGASALRAGLMALVALYGRATGRTYSALRALLAVFVLLVLWNPLSLLYDPGFQLSFLATLGLILLTAPLSARLLWVRQGTFRETLATTLAAQLFVLPLLLYETGNLSLVAIPANLFVLPVVPFAMLFAAVAGVGALIIPPLATILALPAYALLSYIIMVAEVGAKLPFAALALPAFPVLLLAPCYALIGWFVVYIRKSAPEGAVSKNTNWG